MRWWGIRRLLAGRRLPARWGQIIGIIWWNGWPVGNAAAPIYARIFLRGGGLLKDGGMAGLLATNTIAQGDSREVGLDQLAAQGFAIPRAVASAKWPGEANLEVAHVWLRRGAWAGAFVLNGQAVAGITPFLTVPGAIAGNPYRLAANADLSFIGSTVVGMGFVLTPEEAQALIARNSDNKDCLFPYLNGEDLNSRFDQSPSRWIINFYNWPLNRQANGVWSKADAKQRKAWLQSGSVPADYLDPVAADYSDLLEIIEERAKPERLQNNDKVARQYWWRFKRPTLDLYSTIAGMRRVLVVAATSRTLAFSFMPIGIVFSHATVVFPFNQDDKFAVMQSIFHENWSRNYTSSMKGDLRYTPSDCFETFPFPLNLCNLDDIGERYYEHRQSIMQTRQEGLTKTYNRFHNPQETAADIQKLRELHVEMDETVAAAYGWSDLKLQHGFHETKQGLRYTISEAARREVLDRLLRLNHERYAEEVKQGLHDKKGGNRKANAKDAPDVEGFALEGGAGEVKRRGGRPNNGQQIPTTRHQADVCAWNH